MSASRPHAGRRCSRHGRRARRRCRAPRRAWWSRKAWARIVIAVTRSRGCVVSRRVFLAGLSRSLATHRAFTQQPSNLATTRRETAQPRDRETPNYNLPMRTTLALLLTFFAASAIAQPVTVIKAGALIDG